MISRNLYINIIVRACLIALAAVFTAWVIAGRMPLLFIVSGIIAFLAFTANLIWYVNSTNRRLGYFFESVKNEDSSLSFPDNTTDKRLIDISRSLAAINSQIRQLRIDSRQQEEYFKALLEHAATGILTFNSQGFILHANSAAKRMLSVDVLTHIKQLERVDMKVFQAIRNARPGEQQLVSLTSERTSVQLSLKASTFTAGDEELTILSIQDIRKELDDKEVESWIRIIRIMMHEIINSISPITSLSESLYGLYSENGSPVSQEKVDDTTIRRTLQGLETIRTQGKGLLSFIESYRKLTRIPVPDKAKIKAGDLLSRVAILYPSFGFDNRPELTVACTPADLEIYADETQVTLCLINLVRNAVQANEQNPDAKITVKAAIRNGHSEICITDNGPGIPPELIDEIFVPFFTTRAEGTGIGLSISRQIMRLHGGNLSVKSSPGKETVFTLTFQE